MIPIIVLIFIFGFVCGQGFQFLVMRKLEQENKLLEIANSKLKNQVETLKAQVKWYQAENLTLLKMCAMDVGLIQKKVKVRKNPFLEID